MHLLYTPKPRIVRLAHSGLGVYNRCMYFKFRVSRANSANSVHFLAPPSNQIHVTPKYIINADGLATPKAEWEVVWLGSRGHWIDSGEEHFGKTLDF